MLPVDIIADGLAKGMDKWDFANRFLTESIRRFVEKEGLPRPLNPARRGAQSPSLVSKPELMGALEQAGFRLHRRWQYKASGKISSFYEGTFGSIGVHCDWECPLSSPEAGSFALYFRPPASINHPHWSYLAPYDKASFPQQLAEIILFLNKLTKLEEEFELLFAKAEKKLSVRKTLLASMLRHITSEPGLRYNLQQEAQGYLLQVGMPICERRLRFHLPPPATATQVQQMMEMTLRLIREMPQACGSSYACSITSEQGRIPDMHSPHPPLAPAAQRMQDFLESLSEREPESYSFRHMERSSALGVQLEHERYLLLSISHGISDRELAELPNRIRQLSLLFNAAGTLQVELTPLPENMEWTKNPAKRR